ncbi:MAG: peptidoglycan DD-metalloendopeptidase family protein [Deltaproteobacteria bacterium]|nr:peptidoglycan DD-metalloendopeptidase family protein [Deltaproteobacteria bacterium]
MFFPETRAAWLRNPPASAPPTDEQLSNRSLLGRNLVPRTEGAPPGGPDDKSSDSGPDFGPAPGPETGGRDSRPPASPSRTAPAGLGGQTEKEIRRLTENMDLSLLDDEDDRGGPPRGARPGSEGGGGSLKTNLAAGSEPGSDRRPVPGEVSGPVSDGPCSGGRELVVSHVGARGGPAPGAAENEADAAAAFDGALESLPGPAASVPVSPPEDGGGGRAGRVAAGLPAAKKTPAGRLGPAAALGAAVLIVLAAAGLILRLAGRDEAPAPPPAAVTEAAEAGVTIEIDSSPPGLAPGPMAADREFREGLVVDVYEVPPGGTLSEAFEKLSISSGHRRALYQMLERAGLLTQLRPGEEFRAWWSSPDRAEEDLERVEHRKSVGEPRPLILLPGGPSGFYALDMATPSREIHQAAEGEVGQTFWEAGLAAGLEPRVILLLVDMLASQIDFVSDIRGGDSFQILFLGEYQDGRLAAGSEPRIEMIRFINQGDRYEFYRHEGADGSVGYFDAKFLSIRKTFFKSPLQYSRISSGFTQARAHPILKIVRPHLGVDYAAPSGTPVSAVADGVVRHAGWRGDYGRMVVIEHEGGYTTMYGHLSQIAKGVKVNERVRQGDLIGNVGSTGLATGPHLDFRIQSDGKFVDPEVVLAEQQGRPMPQEERMGFSAKATRDQEQLKQLLEEK